MTERDQVEYAALRATIRERGTARVYIFAAGLGAWGGILVATAALAPTPLAPILPLAVLAGVFEAVFALHVGVERVGRYIQVFHEGPTAAPGPIGWEHAVMAFGRPRGAATADALFSVPFLIAALVNVAPALVLDPTRAELLLVGGVHALFVLRLAVARAAAARQRAVDLQRFEAVKHDAPR